MRVARLFLIDDSEADVYLIREGLLETSRGSILEVAKDGAEALDVLLYKLSHQPDELPDLILLDLNLPKKNGRVVLAEIKANERLRQIPIILLSSADSLKDRAELMRLGADVYVVKPFILRSVYALTNAVERLGLKIISDPEKREEAFAAFSNSLSKLA